MSNWTLFSNHGHVLLVLADDPEARLRDVAQRVDITERAVQKIVRDLQQDGLLSVSKQGRRNRYRINTRKTLQQPLETNRTIGQLISLMRDGRPPGGSESARASVAESLPASKREFNEAPSSEADTGSGRLAPEPEVIGAAVSIPDSRPEPKPEPKPEPEPAATTVASETVESAGVQEGVAEAEETGEGSAVSRKKAGKKKGPPSSEQQGSLF